MGSIGSGRKPWSTQSTVEQHRFIDIWDWTRQGLLKPGLVFHHRWQKQDVIVAELAVYVELDQVIIAYRYDQGDGTLILQEFPIRLERTPCHYGQRAWFRCPAGCGRRAVRLYLGDDHQFTCRQCQHLGYRSQRERTLQRGLRRLTQLQEELGEAGRNGQRPKGMRQCRYQKLLIAINATTLTVMQSVFDQITPRSQVVSSSV